MPEPVYAVMEHGQSYELVHPPVRWSQSAPAPNVSIPYEVAQRFLATEKWHVRDARDGTIRETHPRFRFYARYEDIPLAKRNPARAQVLPALRIEGAEVDGREGLVLEPPASSRETESTPPPSTEPAPPESTPSDPATTPADARTRAQRVRDQIRKNAEANGASPSTSDAPKG